MCFNRFYSIHVVQFCDLLTSGDLISDLIFINFVWICREMQDAHNEW